MNLAVTFEKLDEAKAFYLHYQDRVNRTAKTGEKLVCYFQLKEDIFMRYADIEAAEFYKQEEERKKKQEEDERYYMEQEQNQPRGKPYNKRREGGNDDYYTNKPTHD